MFGTKLSNIVAKNVTAIIPEPFKSLHDEILRRKLSRKDRKPLNKVKPKLQCETSNITLSDFL